jgi:hypothetical protein
VEELQKVLEADYVVLGGGNVKKIETLPATTRLEANDNAFIGGYRLWSAKQGAGSSAFRQVGMKPQRDLSQIQPATHVENGNKK